MKMSEELKQYFQDWEFSKYGCKVFRESELVCDIRGWGYLQKLGEDKAIEIQEAIGQFIADAPATINQLRKENEALILTSEALGIKNELYKELVEKYGRMLDIKESHAVEIFKESEGEKMEIKFKQLEVDDAPEIEPKTGDTYYYAEWGSNSNPRTQQNPWRDKAYVESLAKQGDTVIELVRRGEK
jgi:hypothetical protein